MSDKNDNAATMVIFCDSGGALIKNAAGKTLGRFATHQEAIAALKKNGVDYRKLPEVIGVCNVPEAAPEQANKANKAKAAAE